MYKTILKPLFFRLQPERAHRLTLALLEMVLATPGAAQIFKRLYQFEDPSLEKEVFGLTFKNPVGLAAGFDKDGKHIKSMASLGFGFIEVGTVTPLPQSGNPQPRLFRLPADQALINRMGFNNGGVAQLVEQLKKPRPEGLIIGGNIGKNKVTPNAEAIKDYEKCFEALFPYVDYFVVNVSSPNTPNLRELQDKKPLQALLSRVQELNRAKGQPKPVLLKIAPDLTDGQLDDIIDIVQATKIDGVIATNTTIAREPLSTSRAKVEAIGNGGLSGKPLKERATEVIRYLKDKTNGELKVIGVGGIASAADAREKLAAGADLVQVYSGMVYSGPGLIKSIKKGIISAQ
ncbi:MAG TPA: quinone-dependent dihydroorotate dehydrogenase [Saprospiraceae bacterium]|nr:quinone-dependent dihydroorotate dehydrogenase [Saprospiraceae bacterium]